MDDVSRGLTPKCQLDSDRQTWMKTGADVTRWKIEQRDRERRARLSASSQTDGIMKNARSGKGQEFKKQKQKQKKNATVAVRAR